ncbi:MAG: VOC family protein [Proteobacteria bacterium]|nr:VOC family protein [Pseudomonadota bacterium]
MSHLPGKFVWFEHASSDPAKAQAFYESLFDWRVENMPMGDQQYAMIMNGADGIGGFTQANEGARWVSYVSVPDVDKTYAAALAVGAKSESPPMDYGPVGRGAAVVDPTGARISLWKSAQADRPDQDTPVGGWVWNELATSDPQAALKFYTGLIGYTQDAMPMNPGGAYYLLKTEGDKGRAGVMQSSDPKMPSQWVPYVHVGDCDATLAKAAQLGATVCMPATDIPGVGRIGMLRDPQGASIAVIKPMPPS